MRRKIYQVIAGSLEKSIIEDSRFVLLPINELAEKYDVSYPTMWKAVQALVAKGLITTRPGRAIRVAPHVRAAALSKPTPLDRVSRAVRARIVDGTYKAGRHLPKVGYFAVSERVSPLTVLRALSRLAKDNLVHKNRNRWLAGPASSVTTTRRSSMGDGPVVLVASESPQTFTTGYTDPFSQRFTAPFTDECMLHGISLRPALLAGTQEEMPGIPVGIDQAKSVVRRLGSRYQGTLVLSAFPRELGVDRWIETMNRFGRPVVFFDHTDKGGFLTRKGLSDRKNFFRLHLHDRNGVRTALAAMQKAGHSTIGVHGGELYDWSRKRMEIIRECAGELSPSLTIAEAAPAEPVWNLYERKDRYLSIVSLMQAQVKAKPRTASDTRQILLRAAPSLVALLNERQPTALITLNDEIARDYVLWFHGVGMKIPRDLSLVAFDNTPTNLLVSSVDWGFSRLGYLAAHLFIGDIPVHADRNGSIAGTCTLVDRGSTGRPAKTVRRLPG